MTESYAETKQRIGRLAKSDAKCWTVKQETFIPLENHSSISAAGFVQNRPLPNAFGTCESCGTLHYGFKSIVA
jgi:hypothetical protein